MSEMFADADVIDVWPLADVASIEEIEAQYQAGGDPATILSDLADYVHWVTRLKVVKEGALADSSRTEAEKTRGAAHAQKCGIAHLTRAWSMLLKGIREAQLHSDPLMAAEMVLIRLCHAADLPGGEELAKIVKQAQGSDRVVPMSAREMLRSKYWLQILLWRIRNTSPSFGRYGSRKRRLSTGAESVNLEVLFFSDKNPPNPLHQLLLLFPKEAKLSKNKAISQKKNLVQRQDEQ